MPALRNSRGARLAGALLLAALAVIAAWSYLLRQERVESSAEPVNAAPQAPIEVDRFSARLEKSDDEERLTISLRLRANVAEAVDGFAFVVARTERGTPKPWAIWPAGSPGLAISAGGHFHAAHPASGHPVSLSSAWERIDAVLPRTPGQPPFDSVVIYVVGPSGNILLARPFAL